MSGHGHGDGDAHEHGDGQEHSDGDGPAHGRGHASALSRRRVLQALGMGTAAPALAASSAAAGTGGSAATPARRVLNPWTAGAKFLRGDHHIHSHYSPDGMNPVSRLVTQAARFGLDWMVVTDHGGVAHLKYSLDAVTRDIAAARKANPGILVYQGLEWNVPGAEHATVFVPPGPQAVPVLRALEAGFDGEILAASVEAGGLGKIPGPTSPEGERYALEALRYLDRQVTSGRVPVALMLANHPARRGLDSPHELRNWRDAAPRVAIGMEGAPGHQALGLPASAGGADGTRGGYDQGPEGDSFAGYSELTGYDPYRTHGGFDAFTATVGGVWDSLLAEGKPWWVTASSDSHRVHGDLFGPGDGDHDATGSVGMPVPSDSPLVSGDFWPGAYSTTLVAAPYRRYVDVMTALRSGQVIAVHGRLVDGLDVRVRSLGRGDRRGVTLGGRTWARRGDDVEVSVTVLLPAGPNHGGFVPKPAKVDLIAGPVTGPARNRDTLAAPGTRVVRTFAVPSSARRSVTFRHVMKRVSRSFYVRLRGSDGKRLTSSGGPLPDESGNADPWQDLWFYANPVFVDVVP